MVTETAVEWLEREFDELWQDYGIVRITDSPTFGWGKFRYYAVRGFGTGNRYYERRPGTMMELKHD